MRTHIILTRNKELYKKLIDFEMFGRTTIKKQKGVELMLRKMKNNISIEKKINGMIHIKKKNHKFKICPYLKNATK